MTMKRYSQIFFFPASGEKSRIDADDSFPDEQLREL